MGTTEERRSDAAEPRPISDGLYGPYIKHRDFLLASEQTTSTSYTKWLLTLSGGALALSITFAREIAAPKGAMEPWYLLAAWIALTLAVGFGLLGIFVSQRAHEKSRVLLDSHLQAVLEGTGTEGGFWGRYNDDHARLRSVKCVGHMNIGSMGLFLVGVTMLAFFAYYNVPGKE